MIRIFKNINFQQRFFLIFAVIIFVFAFSFILKSLFPFAQLLLIIGLLAAFFDAMLLFSDNVAFDAERSHSNLLSLGDKNKIHIRIRNKSNYKR